MIRGMDADATLALLKQILAGTVRLPGAACVGRHRLFDSVVGNGHRYRDQEHTRIARAAACCATCPARAQCPTATTSSTITLAVGVRRSSARVRPRPRHRPARSLSRSEATWGNVAARCTLTSRNAMITGSRQIEHFS
jgi:hypothetical protein